MVIKYAPTSKKILDLGCGACCISKQLQLSGREVTPMDVVDKGVCLKPELFDGMKIPYADKVFDFRYMFLCITPYRQSRAIIERITKSL